MYAMLGCEITGDLSVPKQIRLPLELFLDNQGWVFDVKNLFLTGRCQKLSKTPFCRQKLSETLFRCQKPCLTSNSVKIHFSSSQDKCACTSV